MLSKTCLICSKNNPRKNASDSENLIVGSFADVPPNDDCHKGAKENRNVDNQLQVVFLLRKLLEIPEDTCCLLLQHFGNPNLWVECCEDCSNLVKKCHTAFEQIISLQKYYEKLRLDIKNTILKSQNRNTIEESKCEAIVRSYVITQDVARFIKSSETETQNQKFGNTALDCEFTRPLEMPSNFLGEEQAFIKCGPLLENDSHKEIPVPFTETIADNGFFISSSTTADINRKSGCSESDTAAEVDLTDLDRSLTHPFLFETPVLLEKIHGVKCEVENSCSLNLDKEEDEMTGSILKTSEVQQNVEQSKNEYQNLKQMHNNRHQRTEDADNTKTLFAKYTDEDSSTVDSYSYILPDDNFEAHSDTHADSGHQVGTSTQSNDGNDFNSLAPKNKRMTQGTSKTNECNICGKMFKYNQGVNRHQKLHTREERICKFCGWSCTDNSNLLKHIMTHTGKAPYACDICGKAFVKKQYLVDHQKIHIEGKPHACDICEKSFIDKRNLREHRLLHTGEKPFECEVCGMSFRLKRKLTAHHLESHT